MHSHSEQWRVPLMQIMILYRILENLLFFYTLTSQMLLLLHGVDFKCGEEGKLIISVRHTHTHLCPWDVYLLSQSYSAQIHTQTVLSSSLPLVSAQNRSCLFVCLQLLTWDKISETLTGPTEAKLTVDFTAKAPSNGDQSAAESSPWQAEVSPVWSKTAPWSSFRKFITKMETEKESQKVKGHWLR